MAWALEMNSLCNSENWKALNQHNCSVLQNGGRLFLGKGLQHFINSGGIQFPQSLSNPGEKVCIGGFSEAGEVEWGFQNLVSGHCIGGSLPCFVWWGTMEAPCLALYGRVPWNCMVGYHGAPWGPHTRLQPALSG